MLTKSHLLFRVEFRSVLPVLLLCAANCFHLGASQPGPSTPGLESITIMGSVAGSQADAGRGPEKTHDGSASTTWNGGGYPTRTIMWQLANDDDQVELYEIHILPNCLPCTAAVGVQFSACTGGLDLASATCSPVFHTYAGSGVVNNAWMTFFTTSTNPAKPVKYLKATVTGWGGSWVSIREVHIYGKYLTRTISLTQLESRQVVPYACVASGSYNGEIPERTYDGDVATSWNAGGGVVKEIVLALGSPDNSVETELFQVDIWPVCVPCAAGGLVQFWKCDGLSLSATCEASPFGVWQTSPGEELNRFGYLTMWKDTVGLAAKSVKYLKIRFVIWGGSWVALREFRLFGQYNTPTETSSRTELCHDGSLKSIEVVAGAQNDVTLSDGTGLAARVGTKVSVISDGARYLYFGSTWEAESFLRYDTLTKATFTIPTALGVDKSQLSTQGNWVNGDPSSGSLLYATQDTTGTPRPQRVFQLDVNAPYTLTHRIGSTEGCAPNSNGLLANFYIGGSPQYRVQDGKYYMASNGCNRVFVFEGSGSWPISSYLGTGALGELDGVRGVATLYNPTEGFLTKDEDTIFLIKFYTKTGNARFRKYRFGVDLVTTVSPAVSTDVNTWMSLPTQGLPIEEVLFNSGAHFASATNTLGELYIINEIRQTAPTGYSRMKGYNHRTGKVYDLIGGKQGYPAFLYPCGIHFDDVFCPTRPTGVILRHSFYSNCDTPSPTLTETASTTLPHTGTDSDGTLTSTGETDQKEITGTVHAETVTLHHATASAIVGGTNSDHAATATQSSVLTRGGVTDHLATASAHPATATTLQGGSVTHAAGTATSTGAAPTLTHKETLSGAKQPRTATETITEEDTDATVEHSSSRGVALTSSYDQHPTESIQLKDGTKTSTQPLQVTAQPLKVSSTASHSHLQHPTKSQSLQVAPTTAAPTPTATPWAQNTQAPPSVGRASAIFGFSNTDFPCIDSYILSMVVVLVVLGVLLVVGCVLNQLKENEQHTQHHKSKSNEAASNVHQKAILDLDEDAGEVIVVDTSKEAAAEGEAVQEQQQQQPSWMSVSLWRSLAIHHRWIGIFLLCRGSCAATHGLLAAAHLLTLLWVCAALIIPATSADSDGIISISDYGLVAVVGIGVLLAQVTRPFLDFYFYLYSVREEEEVEPSCCNSCGDGTSFSPNGTFTNQRLKESGVHIVDPEQNRQQPMKSLGLSQSEKATLSSKNLQGSMVFLDQIEVLEEAEGENLQDNQQAQQLPSAFTLGEDEAASESKNAPDVDDDVIHENRFVLDSSSSEDGDSDGGNKQDHAASYRFGTLADSDEESGSSEGGYAASTLKKHSRGAGGQQQLHDDDDVDDDELPTESVAASVLKAQSSLGLTGTQGSNNSTTAGKTLQGLNQFMWSAAEEEEDDEDDGEEEPGQSKKALEDNDSSSGSGSVPPIYLSTKTFYIASSKRRMGWIVCVVYILICSVFCVLLGDKLNEAAGVGSGSRLCTQYERSVLPLALLVDALVAQPIIVLLVFFYRSLLADSSPSAGGAAGPSSSGNPATNPFFKGIHPTDGVVILR